MGKVVGGKTTLVLRAPQIQQNKTKQNKSITSQPFAILVIIAEEYNNTLAIVYDGSKLQGG